METFNGARFATRRSLAHRFGSVDVSGDSADEYAAASALSVLRAERPHAALIVSPLVGAPFGSSIAFAALRSHMHSAGERLISACWHRRRDLDKETGVESGVDLCAVSGLRLLPRLLPSDVQSNVRRVLSKLAGEQPKVRTVKAKKAKKAPKSPLVIGKTANVVRKDITSLHIITESGQTITEGDEKGVVDDDDDDEKSNDQDAKGDQNDDEKDDKQDELSPVKRRRVVKAEPDDESPSDDDDDLLLPVSTSPVNTPITRDALRALPVNSHRSLPFDASNKVEPTKRATRAGSRQLKQSKLNFNA